MQVLLAHVLQVAAEHLAFARILVQDCRDDRDQSRLAASRRTHEHEQLAAMDFKVDAAQRHDARIARAVCLGHASAVHRNVVARIYAAFQVWGSSTSSCHELPFSFLSFKEKRKALGLAS